MSKVYPAEINLLFSWSKLNVCQNKPYYNGVSAGGLAKYISLSAGARRLEPPCLLRLVARVNVYIKTGNNQTATLQ